jgi:hypothetical protein
MTAYRIFTSVSSLPKQLAQQFTAMADAVLYPYTGYASSAAREIIIETANYTLMIAILVGAVLAAALVCAGACNEGCDVAGSLIRTGVGGSRIVHDKMVSCVWVRERMRSLSSIGIERSYIIDRRPLVSPLC